MTRPAAAALLLTCAVMSGCGYRLAGTVSDLPSHIERIAVTTFENRTTRPEIEQRVTEEVTRVLNTRGRYRTVAQIDDANAVLEGAVTSYRAVPVQFTGSGRATRVEAVITVQATMRDVIDDTVLWSQSGLIFKEQFDVPESGVFIDESGEALDELARGVAEVLVTSIFEGF